MTQQPRILNGWCRCCGQTTETSGGCPRCASRTVDATGRVVSCSCGKGPPTTYDDSLEGFEVDPCWRGHRPRGYRAVVRWATTWIVACRAPGCGSVVVGFGDDLVVACRDWNAQRAGERRRDGA